MGRKDNKKTKHKKKSHSHNTYSGVLEVTRSGVGFVVVEDLHTDILVRPADFNTALHGDKVVVAVKEQRQEGKRMQGIVKEVLERKQSEFIGTLQMNKGFAFFVPDSDRKMPDVFIPQNGINGAEDKDRVVIKVTSWEQGSGKRPLGEVITVLKAENDSDMAMKEILLENGFPLEFPDDVLEEAARIP